MTKDYGTYIGNAALEKNGFTNTVTTDNHITYAGSDVVCGLSNMTWRAH